MTMSERCDAASDAATSVAMGQPDVDMDAMNECIDEILGENAIGDFARDIYHHPDKICKCVADLGDAVPSCLLKISIPEDEVPEEMEDFVPEGLDDIKVPLSLLKKATCLIGIGCDAIDDWCETQLEALDHCLPDAGKASFSCLTTIEKCALEADPPIAITAPPLLTTSELPDACQRVYAETSTTNVPERYSHFNAVCNSDAVSTKPAEEEEDWSSSWSSDESSEAKDSSSTASVTVGASMEDEADEEDEGVNTKTVVPVVAVAGVIVAIAAFLIVKKRRTGVDSTFASTNNFSHVGTVDEFDEPLAFEEGYTA